MTIHSLPMAIAPPSAMTCEPNMMRQSSPMVTSPHTTALGCDVRRSGDARRLGLMADDHDFLRMLRDRRRLRQACSPQQGHESGAS
jgi:hypothetical protein